MSMRKDLPQMTDHVGVAKKGPQQAHRLTFAAPGASADTAIHDGSLISLNANGAFVLGCAASTDGLNIPMAMMSINDVSNAGTVQYGYQGVGGNYAGLVFTGGYEVETSEFVAGTYKPNDAITGATGSDLGKFTKMTAAVYGAQPMLGVVSKGTYTDGAYGGSRLAFWTTFIPGSVADASSSSN